MERVGLDHQIELNWKIFPLNLRTADYQALMPHQRNQHHGSSLRFQPWIKSGPFKPAEAKAPGIDLFVL